MYNHMSMDLQSTQMLRIRTLTQLPLRVDVYFQILCDWLFNLIYSEVAIYLVKQRRDTTAPAQSFIFCQTDRRLCLS